MNLRSEEEIRTRIEQAKIIAYSYQCQYCTKNHINSKDLVVFINQSGLVFGPYCKYGPNNGYPVAPDPQYHTAINIEDLNYENVMIVILHKL